MAKILMFKMITISDATPNKSNELIYVKDIVTLTNIPNLDK